MSVYGRVGIQISSNLGRIFTDYTTEYAKFERIQIGVILADVLLIGGEYNEINT